MVLCRPQRVTPVGDAHVRETTAGHIKVVVRVRPENEKECQGNYGVVVRPMDERVLIFDPCEQGSPDFYHGKRRTGRDLLKRKNKDMKFAFDHVFDMHANNEQVYQQSTKGIIDGLLDGFNGSVFAYGATGAGKTFTMLGNPTSPGVIFLTMMDLYNRIDAIKEEKTCDVAVSYLEVYNEQIRDLLMPTGFLPLREDPQKGVIVTGLSLHKPQTAQELLHMLQFGNTNRTQHPTDANAESSRSHAVFQVFVRQRDRTGNLSADVRVGKMSLIDLAGSERATVTTNRGARFREGANINRSLLALGNCINALAEGKSKGYIPYRNSKLTRLLKDSLGGNCRTVMIAAVSPSSMSYEDTYNTLKYANRAKNIKANLKRNVISVDFHVTQYAKIVKDLRQEVCELKLKVQHYEEGTVLHTKSALDTPYRSEISRLQGVLTAVFQDRLSIRREVMELEGSDRDLAYKIHRKELHLKRISQVFSDPAVFAKISSKLERYITNGQQRRGGIQDRKKGLQLRMDDNIQKLAKAESEIKMAGKDESMPEVLEASLRSHHLEVELKDTRRQVKYLKKLCRAQDREAQASEKLILRILAIAKQQYMLLKGHGLLTSGMQSDYETVQHMVEGEKEVAWADQSVCESGDAGFSIEGTEDFNINMLVEFPLLGWMSAKAMTAIPGSGRRGFRAPRTASKTPASATNCRIPPRPNLQNIPKFHLDAASPLPSGGHSQNMALQTPGDTPLHLKNACHRELQPETLSNGAHQTPVHKVSQHSLASVQSQGLSTSHVSPCQTHMRLDPEAVVHTMQSDLNATFSKEDATLKPEIDSGTVTKLWPLTETTRDKENRAEAQIKNPRLGVVRAMDFSNMPVTPPSDKKLTFAEAVKFSPSVFQGGNTSSPRSPLSSRENLPSFSMNSTENDRSLPEMFPLTENQRSKLFPSAGLSSVTPYSNYSKQHQNARRITYAANEMPHHPANMSSVSAHKNSKYGKTLSSAQRVLDRNKQVAKTLNKFGLPSAVQRLVQLDKKPSYMQMTKAASQRWKGHQRSMSSEKLKENLLRDCHSARRIVNDDKTRRTVGTRTLALSRSKSSSSLKRSAFF